MIKTVLILLFSLIGLTVAQAGDFRQIGNIAVPLGAPYADPEDNFDQSHNISGAICPEATWCIIVADEKRGFHRIALDRSKEQPVVSYDAALDLDLPTDEFLAAHDLKKKQLKELDMEAVAAAGADILFVGSHANKRNSGEVNAGSHLVAIAAIEDLKSKTQVPARWASLDRLFQRDGMFPTALNRQLQCGGLNIEGATVFGDRLLIGLRSPTSAAGEAYVVSTPLAGLLGEDFSGAELHRLPVGQPFIGIRSMDTVGDRVLLVTGDAGVNDLKAGVTMECPANVNKEDPSRPFELRVWKPGAGDTLEKAPVTTFPDLVETDFKGKPARAKLEAIAADPGKDGAFIVFYDGSDKVFYLSRVELP